MKPSDWPGLWFAYEARNERARSDYERLLVKFKNNTVPPRLFDVETVRMIYAATARLRVANGAAA